MGAIASLRIIREITRVAFPHSFTRFIPLLLTSTYYVFLLMFCG